VIFEESVSMDNAANNSIKNLKGIVPKPEKAISLDEMKRAIEQQGARP
jgi:hypothetical protein